MEEERQTNEGKKDKKHRQERKQIRDRKARWADGATDRRKGKMRHEGQG